MQNKSTELLSTTGIQINKDACVVIVNTEWNSEIINTLTESCVNILKENGIENVKIFTVPGAVEIPFAVNTIWQANTAAIDAFVVFGCVIKGGTPHFDYVCKIVTEGVTQLNLTLPIPTIFGVLTVDYKEQALDRIKNGRVGDKGAEAAVAALKMIQLSEEAKF